MGGWYTNHWTKSWDDPSSNLAQQREERWVESIQLNSKMVSPGKLTWNLKITCKKNMRQTFINFGCILTFMDVEQNDTSLLNRIHKTILPNKKHPYLEDHPILQVFNNHTQQAFRPVGVVCAFPCCNPRYRKARIIRALVWKSRRHWWK